MIQLSLKKTEKGMHYADLWPLGHDMIKYLNMLKLKCEWKNKTLWVPVRAKH